MVFKDTQTKLENPQTNSLQPKKQHSPHFQPSRIIYNKLWLTKQVNTPPNTVIVFNLIQGNNTFEGVTLIFPI